MDMCISLVEVIMNLELDGLMFTYFRIKTTLFKEVMVFLKD